jgi:hypothetical protein
MECRYTTTNQYELSIKDLGRALALDTGHRNAAKYLAQTRVLAAMQAEKAADYRAAMAHLRCLRMTHHGACVGGPWILVADHVCCPPGRRSFFSPATTKPMR